jgi:SAM-dependent methyltransferase
MNCRMCLSKNLKSFLDLGHVPRVDRFLIKNELNEPEILYPLNLLICEKCGLVQLGYVVSAELLFNEHYAYDSRITKKRLDSYHEFSKYVIKNFNLQKDSLIIDIGSNTGLLLDCFQNQGMQVLGIDPSSNIVKIANEKGIDTIDGFFNVDLVNTKLSNYKSPSVITATNVFAHIQDYQNFGIALKKLIKNDGIFIFQVPYFLHLLENLEYDTIYHEHLAYFGLKPLKEFFNTLNMEIFQILETDLDGGSIRCFVSKKGSRKISSIVETMFKKEEESDMYSMKRLETFAKDVSNQKNALVELLVDLKKKNKRVVGVSAPAKGMTLLNYCKIDDSLLEYITEKSELKIGKYSPGMHIEVKPDSVLLEDKPDYALLLAWNFADEIMNNLKEFKNNGGHFIIPIPFPKII